MIQRNTEGNHLWSRKFHYYDELHSVSKEIQLALKISAGSSSRIKYNSPQYEEVLTVRDTFSVTMRSVWRNRMPSAAVPMVAKSTLHYYLQPIPWSFLNQWIVLEAAQSRRVRTVTVNNYRLNETLYYPTNAHIYYVHKIKIIKYLKVLQHVSDHRGSIIREPCTVLG